jgi:hypothetical protein
MTEITESLLETIRQFSSELADSIEYLRETAESRGFKITIVNLTNILGGYPMEFSQQFVQAFDWWISFRVSLILIKSSFISRFIN